jgi:hypothetical protein
VTGLKNSLPADRYVCELIKLWDKKKTLEEIFHVEKDSHFKVQEAIEDHIIPIKSEPAKKKIEKADIVPTVKRDLFYGTPLSFTSAAACSSSSSGSGQCSSDHRSSDS